MKKCTYCGKNYSEQTQICPIDGNSLESDLPPSIPDPTLPPPIPEPSWLDTQFMRTPHWAYILAATCFALPMLIISLVAMVACKEPKARTNARFAAGVSVIMMIAFLFFQWYWMRVATEIDRLNLAK